MTVGHRVSRRPGILPPSTPRVSLALIAVSTLLSMSVWFSATFVIPQVRAEWDLGSAGASALTIAVQVGFVTGAFASAATGMADSVSCRLLMCVGGLGAAVTNAGLLLADGLSTAVPLRFATGVFLAAVYPSALKEVSTWYASGRGKALGVMIGALTLGSALPHLVGAVGGVDWRAVIAVTSVMSLAGGLVVCGIRGEGPHPFPRRPFSFGGGLRALRDTDVALANVGYAGHMWELYAMWASLGAFLVALPAVSDVGDPERLAALLAFVCIGVGAVGCWVGGVIGDRWGRPRAAWISLSCSGGAALTLALISTSIPLPLVALLCAFWGFWVIADSAQFSAMVTEHAEPPFAGAALAFQLAIGYVTTMITLALVPYVVTQHSWQTAFLVLAIGPAVGASAMVVADQRARGSALR